MSIIEERYKTSSYIEKNPTWDAGDSSWKAENVMHMLYANNLKPQSICEVGCGSGGVLASLRDNMPDIKLAGFDIAPDATRFWDAYKNKDIEFHVGNFFDSCNDKYDLILLLDVLEHVANPWDFLSRLKLSGSFFILHFPLDLSAISVLREKPLLHVRSKVGHIHYFTRNLALELLKECGYQIIAENYTQAYMSGPQATFRTRLARLPRWLIHTLLGDAGVRLIGGETLMVLAKAAENE